MLGVSSSIVSKFPVGEPEPEMRAVVAQSLNLRRKKHTVMKMRLLLYILVIEKLQLFKVFNSERV